MLPLPFIAVHSSSSINLKILFCEQKNMLAGGFLPGMHLALCGLLNSAYYVDLSV